MAGAERDGSAIFACKGGVGDQLTERDGIVFDRLGEEPVEERPGRGRGPAVEIAHCTRL